MFVSAYVTPWSHHGWLKKGHLSIVLGQSEYGKFD